MEHSGNTQVIRQGTFDTDPASTLRSKSGGVTRGAVILPVITDQDPPKSLPDIADQGSDLPKVYQTLPVTPIIREGTYDGIDYSKPETESLKLPKARNKDNKYDREQNTVQSNKKVSVTEKNVRKKLTQEDAIEPKFGQKQRYITNNSVIVGKEQLSETESLTPNNNQKGELITKSRKAGSPPGQSDNKLIDEEFELVLEDNIPQIDNKKLSSPVDTSRQHSTSPAGKRTVDSVLQSDTQGNKPRRFSKRNNKQEATGQQKIPETTDLSEDFTGKESSKHISDLNTIEAGYRTPDQPPRNTADFDQTGYTTTMEPSRERHPGSERMVESYESVYKERQTLLEAEAAYKKRIKQLEDEANQFLKSIEQLRVENKELRYRVDELENDDGPQKFTSHQSKNTVVINSETDELILKIKLLEQENQKLTSKVQETDGMVKSLMTKNSQIEKENVELKNLSKHNETKNEKLDKDNTEKEAQLAKANNKTTGLEKELEKMKSQLEKATQNEEKQVREIMDMKNTEKAMKNEVTTLKRENKEMRMEIEKYKEAAEEGEEEAKDGPVTARDKMELKSQIISLQSDNQKLNEENIKLKAESLEQVRKVHDLEKAAKSYESSVTAVESEKLSQIQKIQNDNEKLKNEIATMKESHKDSDAKIKALEVENKATSAALNQKKAELDELMKALSGENLEDEIQGLKSEKETFLKKIKEQEANIEESQKLLEETKIQRDQLESEKKRMAKEISNLENEIEQMKSHQSKHDQDLEKEKKKSNLLVKREKELDEAKSACDKYQKELENIKNEKQKEQENFKKKIQDLNREKQSELNKLKEQLDSQKAQTETLKVSAIDAKEVEELRQELRAIYNKHSQMTIELEQKERIETRAFEMTMRMDQLNSKVKQLEQEKREWMVEKEHFSEIDASNKHLTEENARLKKLLEIKSEMDENNNGDLTHRINKLERLHKDAATRVRQLEGWVGEPNGTVRRPMNMSRHTNQKPYTRSPQKRKSRPPRENMHIEIEEAPVRTRSAENAVEEEIRHSPTPPLSLPPIYPQDSPKRGSYGPGYSQIHRNRILAASKRRV